MYYPVNVTKLKQEGVLTPDQADFIRHTSKQTMIMLAVNTLLCGGIVAAALGFVLFLANAVSVAIAGAMFVLIGVAVLLRGGVIYRMLGNAAVLIGAGMLCSGAAIELIDKLPKNTASLAMLGMGAVVAGLAALGFLKGHPKTRFAAGFVLVMGTALHLFGVVSGGGVGLFGTLPVAVVMFYVAAIVASLGLVTDVRFVTALAIVPFAQMLDTSFSYNEGVYAFFSPEPTVSIVQMSVLVAFCVWAMGRFSDRIAHHAGMLAIMGLVVGNLSFLVASIQGDYIGHSWFEAAWLAEHTVIYTELGQARDIWMQSAIHIPAPVFAVIWAVALAAGAVWAARRGQRGLFNAALVFATIHAFTQARDLFTGEPIGLVIGGMVAVALAWGLWRLNQRFTA